MSSVQDVEQFVREHRGCGTLTPSTSAPIGGKRLLSLACSCGKHFDRWVSAGEAAEAPPPTPAPEPPPPAEPPPIDITPAAAAGESLEDVMRQALESLEPPSAPPVPVAPAEPPSPPPPVASPPPPTPSTPPAPSRPVTPPPPTVQPSSSPAPARPITRTPPPAPVQPPPPPSAPAQRARPGAPQAPPRLPDPLRPPTAAAPPPRPEPPRPSPPRPPAPRHRAENAPPPDRGSLEDALRATLEALNAEGPAALTPTSRPAGGRGSGGDHATLDVTPGGAPGNRPTPDKHALQSALQATLTALEAERKTAPRAGRPGAVPAYAPAAPRRRRRLTVLGAIGISLALAAAVGVGYGLHAVGQFQPELDDPAPRAAPRMRVGDNERASVSQAVAVLRELQAVSRPDVRYRFYYDRVAFAKGDIERHLLNVKDAELRRALDETVALHVLAANAWRAKTLNERDKWEAVGDDPAGELCPQTKRVLAVSDEPANMSRAQWRGHALAAAVPLLWDCAGERLDEVERGLNQR